MKTESPRIPESAISPVPAAAASRETTRSACRHARSDVWIGRSKILRGAEWIVASTRGGDGIGKQMIENYCRIPVEVEYASEFRYRNPVVTKDDVVIAISQSGEMFGAENVIGELTPLAEATLNERFLHEVEYRFQKMK